MNIAVTTKTDCCPTCGQSLNGTKIDHHALLKIPMPRNQKRILTYLAGSYPLLAPRSAIFDAIYFDDGGGGPIDDYNSVRLSMTRLKKRLKPYGWTIASGPFGRGVKGTYRLARIEDV
jgi:hypothetical protein